MADLVRVKRLLEDVAHELATDPVSKDGYRLEWCTDELFDSLRAVRRDQQRMADEFRALAERMSRDEWSMRAEAGPLLRLVLTDEDFDELVKEGA